MHKEKTYAQWIRRRRQVPVPHGFSAGVMDRLDQSLELQEGSSEKAASRQEIDTSGPNQSGAGFGQKDDLALADIQKRWQRLRARVGELGVALGLVLLGLYRFGYLTVMLVTP